MRNLNLIIYFCILGFQPLFGQFAPSEIDSLTENVNIENSPCEKALKLNILARNYCFLDLHKARESVNQGLELSRKNNCLASKALLFNTMSIICDMQGNYSHAYIYSDSALAINYLLGDKHAVASALDNKGIFYTHQSDYTSALKMQLKSLQLFEDLKDTAAIAINLNNLFGVYYLSKDYENALRTGKKAILYFEKSRNLDGLGRMNVNLSMVHRDNQNLDSALFYAIKGLDYFNHLQSREGVADASVNLAEVYLSSGNFNEAEKLITFAAVEYEEMGAYSKKLDIKGSLIKIFEAEGKYFEALNIALEMLNLANTSDQLQYRRDALKHLMHLNQKTGNFQKALQYADAFILANDSVLNQQSLIEINRIKENDATERHIKDLNLVNQKNHILSLQLERRSWIIAALAIFTILLIILTWFYVRQRRMLIERKSLQLEQKLLHSQMNPHFIFNALSAIQNFMYRNEPREAAKFLSSFAKLIRAILDNSNRETITLEEENAWLENYLKLQLLRFENRFSYQIICDPELEKLNPRIPPMLTQPFIENALEHGFRDISWEGLLIVEYTQKNESLKVTIIDNGTGIKSENREQTDHALHATEITHDRIKLLNRVSKHKFSFNIHSPQQGGTIVSFTIPLMH